MHLTETTLSASGMSHNHPSRRPFLASVLSGLTVLTMPAIAYANEFGAMADFAIWVGFTLVYIVLLLVVGIVCGLASRKKSPPRPWKRPAAIGCLIALAIAVVAVFVVTFLLGRANGPTDEALILASGTSATAVPSMLFAWRLLRRSAKPLNSSPQTGSPA